jgi:biopolymer transport protein ExbD
VSYARSISSRRIRRKVHAVFDLQLTSMMDVLVIILIFMLKTFQISTTTLDVMPGLDLPVSRSEDIPTETLQVVITPEAISFENERVVEFDQTADGAGTGDSGYKLRGSDLDEGGLRIPKLFDALVKARSKSEVLRVKSAARDKDGNALPFDGVLAVQADKRIQYDTIRKVMYTGAAAGYHTFRLLARRQDS